MPHVRQPNLVDCHSLTKKCKTLISTEPNSNQSKFSFFSVGHIAVHRECWHLRVSDVLSCTIPMSYQSYFTSPKSGIWLCSLANDSTHLTSAAFGTFCKSNYLLLSPTMKFVAARFNRLPLSQWRPGAWSCLATLFALTQMKIMHLLSMPMSWEICRTWKILPTSILS